MKVSTKKVPKDSVGYRLLGLGCLLTFMGPILLIFFTQGKSAWVVIPIIVFTTIGVALVIYSWRKLNLKISKLIELLFNYGVS